MAKQNRKSNSKVYLLIAATIVVIIVVVALAGGIGKSKAIEVELAKAARVTIVEKVSASGTVQPVTEVKLAPEVSGEIIDLLVEEGDSVRLGETLVKIRPDTWESQLQRARAGLSQQYANLEQSEAARERARANFTRADQDLQRQNKLWEQKVISDADHQLAVQSHAVAKSDLAAAEQAVEASRFVIKSTEASLREAEENFRKTSVVAPMAGVVSKLIVKKGERVVGTATMTGTEMLRIADLNKMEVRVNVNENDIVRVSVGDTALIDVDAYSNIGKEFKGVVTLIANTAKDKLSADAITEFEVRILILSTSYQDLVKQGNKFPFRPGMTATVDIITSTKRNTLSVPLAAVTTRNPKKEKQDEEKQNGPPEEQQSNQNNQAKPARKEDNKVVVFVNEGGKAKMVEVKTGISDYDNIEILEGISDSTEVVKGPHLALSKRLKDGDAIRESEKKDDKKADTDSK